MIGSIFGRGLFGIGFPFSLSPVNKGKGLPANPYVMYINPPQSGGSLKIKRLDQTYSIERLLERVKVLFSSEGVSIIKKAYQFLLKKFATDDSLKMRHLIGVAGILAELELPPEVVAAGLVHNQSAAGVRSALGDGVADLICGTAYFSIKNQPSLRGAEDIGNAVKMLLARNVFMDEKKRMLPFSPEKQIHLHLIHFADNLHTLSDSEKTEEIKEKYGDFFPLRASEHAQYIAKLDGQFEAAAIKLLDYSFRYLQPDKYKQIAKAMGIENSVHRYSMNKYLHAVCEKLKQSLTSDFQKKYPEIEFSLTFTSRIKSVFRGAQKLGLGEKIEDTYGFRGVIRTNIETDYADKYEKAVERHASGSLSLDDFTKINTDYHKVLNIALEVEAAAAAYLQKIAQWSYPKEKETENPIRKIQLHPPKKDNKYQSIHTRFKDKKGRLIQMQLRTRGMDFWANEGGAAHNLYRKLQSGGTGNTARRDIKINNRFLIAQQDLRENAHVYVWDETSKTYKTFVMPRGSTTLDLSYAINKTMDNPYTQFKMRIDGGKNIVNLGNPLEDGDMIILQKNKQAPSITWIKEVKTIFAKLLILKKVASPNEPVNKSIEGTSLLKMKGLNTDSILDEPALKDIARGHNLDNVADLVLAVGWKLINPLSVIEAVAKKCPAKVERVTAEINLSMKEKKNTIDVGKLRQEFIDAGYKVEATTSDKDNPLPNCRIVISGGHNEVRLGKALTPIFSAYPLDKNGFLTVEYKTDPFKKDLTKFEITLKNNPKITSLAPPGNTLLHLILGKFKDAKIRIHDTTIKMLPKNKIKLTASCRLIEGSPLNEKELKKQLLDSLPKFLRGEIKIT